MTQREQVLQLLREVGPRGIHTFELRARYIGNPSQRIAELEAEGHRITHTRERLNGHAIGTRYRLQSSTGPVSLGGPSMIADAGPVEAPNLFDPATTHRPLSPYEADAA